MSTFNGYTNHIVSAPHGVELAVRIWTPSVQSSSAAPWLFYMHGGSTCLGSHYAIPPWIVPEFTQLGFFVVSAGYRLTPHATMSQSMQDCKDALEWCRANMSIIFGQDAIDINRYVIGGESAGARMATLMALTLSPSPRVVLDLYGNTTFYPHQVQDPSPVDPSQWKTDGPSLEEVVREAYSCDLSRAITSAPWLKQTEEETRLEWSLPSYERTPRITLQRAIGRYYRIANAKNFFALRLYECNGEQERAERLHQYDLLYQLQKVDHYPPTVIVQGTKDAIVDPKMSKALEQKLQGMGVAVKGVYVQGAPHMFDSEFKSPSIEGYKETIEPIMAFVKMHI